MKMLSDKDTLRAYFENATRESWGWSNFAWDGQRYESRTVQAGWQCFHHGFSVGKKYGIEESTTRVKESML